MPFDSRLHERMHDKRCVQLCVFSPSFSFSLFLSLPLYVSIAQPDLSIFIVVRRHSLTTRRAAARNSSDFDRTSASVSRFPFDLRRWCRRISGELHAVDLPRGSRHCLQARPKLAIRFAHPTEHFQRTPLPPRGSSGRARGERHGGRRAAHLDRYFPGIEVSAGAMCAEGRYDITGI